MFVHIFVELLELRLPLAVSKLSGFNIICGIFHLLELFILSLLDEIFCMFSNGILLGRESGDRHSTFFFGDINITDNIFGLSRFSSSLALALAILASPYIVRHLFRKISLIEPGRLTMSYL